MMIEKKSRTCKLRSSKTANKTFWIYKKVVWVKLERDKKVKRSFLDAFMHLYKRVCLFVRPSICRSFGPSVGHTRVEIV